MFYTKYKYSIDKQELKRVLTIILLSAWQYVIYVHKLQIQAFFIHVLGNTLIHLSVFFLCFSFQN